MAAALSSLAMNQSLMDQVVPNGPEQQLLNGPKYRGIFQFRFWQYGQFVNVIIDDLLPTQNEQLVTSNISLQSKKLVHFTIVNNTFLIVKWSSFLGPVEIK
jgi:hypothetical protein